MTDHNTQETRNRAVLVGLNADSLPREDNASETTLEELGIRHKLIQPYTPSHYVKV